MRFLRVWGIAIAEVNRHLVEEVVVELGWIGVVASLCDGVESVRVLGFQLKLYNSLRTLVLSASVGSRQYRRLVAPKRGMWTLCS